AITPFLDSLTRQRPRRMSRLHNCRRLLAVSGHEPPTECRAGHRELRINRPAVGMNSQHRPYRTKVPGVSSRKAHAGLLEAMSTTLNRCWGLSSRIIMLRQPIDGRCGKAQLCGRLLALEFIFRPGQPGEPPKQAFARSRNWATIETPCRVFLT